VQCSAAANRGGRPVGVKFGEAIPARFELATVADLDKWAASHDVSRSEAIRRLVELGLKVKKWATTMAAPETSWLDILTRYVLPPILGGAGGLITIGANWGIEKRKQRLQRRRELVTGWRMEPFRWWDSPKTRPWFGPANVNAL
jgi:hypothetical protein